MNSFFVFRLKSFFNRVLMNSIASRCPFVRVRIKLYKMAGLKIEHNVRINPHVFFSTSNIELGQGTMINRFCQVHDGLKGGKLHIGKNVVVSFNVVFCLITHEIGTSSQRWGKRISGDIHIGDGSWIGANVTILPNVKIGKGCVIAAGSLVNSDCKDNCIYAGVPAKLVREIDEPAL